MKGRIAAIRSCVAMVAGTVAAHAQSDADYAAANKRVTQEGVVAEVFVNGSEETGRVATVAIGNGEYVAAAKAYTDIFSPISVPELGFAEMDKANAVPEVMVTRWTGGAHCCVEVTVFTERDGSWLVLEGGAFDGDPEGLAPRDLDGDGAAEIASYDNAFLYRWTSYAGSYAPPAVYAIRGDDIANVTAEPGFAGHVRARLDTMGPIPESGSDRNSWLASYAAMLLLLGEDDPLDYADGAFDPQADWGLTGCADADRQFDCPEDKITRIPFPEGLRTFLRETGYLETQ